MFLIQIEFKLNVLPCTALLPSVQCHMSSAVDIENYKDAAKILSAS